jgi:serine/threonine-protein kinase
VEDGYHLWSENYDRDLKDVFEVQDEISRAIVETLRPTLLGEGEDDTWAEGRELVVAPTHSMKAYDYYLLGRHYWEGRYKEGLATALRHFEKAVESDPEYALPHTGVADSYTVLGLYGFLSPEEAHPKASSAALRALELDEGLSEAHGSLGFYELFLGLDWERSAAELHKAIELKPENAKGHAWLGLLRGLQGRFQEAFAELELARRLDPISSYVTGLTAGCHLYAGEPDAGAALLEDTVARDPDDLLSVWLLEAMYFNMERYVDAAQLGERAVALSGGAWHFKCSVARAYVRAGNPEKAVATLDELHAAADSEYVSPLWLTWIHVTLGEEEKALHHLERAVAQRAPYLFFIHQDHFYSPLWSDPRFGELASKVGSGVVSRVWERLGTGGVPQTGTTQEA